MDGCSRRRLKSQGDAGAGQENDNQQQAGWVYWNRKEGEKKELGLVPMV